MNKVDRLLEKIATSMALDFGSVFNESIELFKKTWLQGFLLQLLVLLFTLPLIIVFYVPFLGLIKAQQESEGADSEAFSNFFESMSLSYVLFVLVAVFVLGAVSVALNAAFYRIMNKLDSNGSVSISDFFYFIKGQYFGKIFMLFMITLLIAIPAALLCYIPLIYAIVPISYFTLIFAFNPELTIGEILKVSFKIGNKKWLISFGLFLVSYIIVAIISLMTCGLGSLFLTTFMYHPIYIIYKNVIGFNKNDSAEKRGLIH